MGSCPPSFSPPSLALARRSGWLAGGCMCCHVHWSVLLRVRYGLGNYSVLVDCLPACLPAYMAGNKDQANEAIEEEAREPAR